MLNTITLNSRYGRKQGMLNALAGFWDLNDNLARIPLEFLEEATKIPVSTLDTKIRNGHGLSVVESLSGMLHVVCGTNSVLHNHFFPRDDLEISWVKGSFFLTRMAAKEQYVGLTSEEIAGMVMAGYLDVVYCPTAESLSETSGMGADRGWKEKRVKTINASTLTALLMSAMGYQTIKHGSYGNTTKVGSTDVPEQFGAEIIQLDPEEIQKILDGCGFWFNDAHTVKTLHYLSHQLMVETVNHIVGPMTPPVGQNTTLYKLMGVNHYVHPETVARAYMLLHQLGVVKLGGAVIIAGMHGKGHVDIGPGNRDWYFDNCYLDEVSPNRTLVSLSAGANFYGTHLVDTNKVFGSSFTDEDIQIPNELDPLMKANQSALQGCTPYAEYLAINTAFALAAHNLDLGGNVISQLPHFGQKALAGIKNGSAFATLQRYVSLSGGDFVSWN